MPGGVPALPAPVRRGNYACFDEEAFAQLDARDVILLEHSGMAQRNADTVNICQDIVSTMQSEAMDQYNQANSFRDTLVAERRARWGERLLWSALAILLVAN